jgi:Protein of unknown function (DUF3830)
MRKLRIELPDDDVCVEACLLDAEAPRTCAAIWACLPIDGEIIHGQWSGPEVVLLLDPRALQLGPENLVHRGILPGDVAFWFGRGGDYVGQPEDISEVAFFYGRGAVPSMLQGPVPVNLFARIDGPLSAFAAVCARTRFDGRKRIVLSRGEADDVPARGA